MIVAGTVPILRMFDLEKALDFYVGYLGMKVDWEFRFHPESPVYLQLSGFGAKLHLSEHHGDGVPGSAVFFEVTGLQEFHQQLAAKPYKFFRPSIQEQSWGANEMSLKDPFGNSLRFNEFLEKQD